MPEIVNAETLATYDLSQIARFVRQTWKNKKGESTIYFAAKPYLDAMSTMDNVNDKYGMDTGKSIVLYFLSNAKTYKGEQAKLVKAELKKRIA